MEDNYTWFYIIVGFAVFGFPLLFAWFASSSGNKIKERVTKLMDQEAPDAIQRHYAFNHEALFGVDGVHDRIVIVTHQGSVQKVAFADIAGVDVFVDGNSVISTSTSDMLARSVVGGVVGALTAKRVTSRAVHDIYVNIRTTNIYNATVRFEILKGFELEPYQDYLQAATEVANIIKAIADQNEERKAEQRAAKMAEAAASAQPAAETPASAPSAAPAATPSVADELRKLADLHTQGILTDAEFQDQKQRLLNS